MYENESTTTAEKCGLRARDREIVVLTGPLGIGFQHSHSGSYSSTLRYRMRGSEGAMRAQCPSRTVCRAQCAVGRMLQDRAIKPLSC